MKKTLFVLLLAAAAMNVLAVTYTAKAKLTLSDGANTCYMTLAESAEYGSATGTEMNMDGRQIALYGLNGSTPLQVVRAVDLTGEKLGLLTNASTDYTITVSEVQGTTLYLYDGASKGYALTEGAVINITAAASTTDNTRFSIKKVAPEDLTLDVCFRNNKLEINGNPYSETIVIKDANGDEITGSPFAANTLLVDMTTIGAAGDRFTVEFAGGARKFIIVKQ